jgi:DNA-binding NarL/FixJ family response regulator
MKSVHFLKKYLSLIIWHCFYSSSCAIHHIVCAKRTGSHLIYNLTKMQDKINIILVDDQQLIRESWKSMLNGDARFSVVAQCINGAEAVIESGNMRTDIILLNINQPALEGYWATEDLVKTGAAKVIAVSDHDTPRFVNQLIEVGVSGFITKSSAFEELKTAIVEVHRGERYICEDVRGSMEA